MKNISIFGEFGFDYSAEDLLRSNPPTGGGLVEGFALMRSCGPGKSERTYPISTFSDPAKRTEALEVLERVLKTGLDRARLERRIAKLESDMKALVAANKALHSHDSLPVSRSLIIPITTFAPEPYEMAGTIYILIENSNGSFVASFLDANMNASSDTESEALEEVKTRMLKLFVRLGSIEDSKLGPGPRKQKKILQSLIRRTR